SNLTAITNDPINQHSPAWSPDGRIAYVADVAGGSEIRIASESGDEVLIEEGGRVSGLTWHQDSRGLAYQVLRPSDGPATELRFLRLGETVSTLLSEPGQDVFPFAGTWLDASTLLAAADGQIRKFSINGGPSVEIAFSAGLAVSRPAYERRRRDHDTDRKQQALGLVSPAISSDGLRVVFAALGDMWLWQPEQKDLRKLTDDVFAEMSPAFSHDGKQLAYVSDRGGRTQLWIHDFASGSSSVVATDLTGISGPSWSPDGSSLAVFASLPGSPIAGQMFVINLQTGESERVFKPVAAQPISWSSDGAFVATADLAPYSSRYREGVYQLSVTDLTSGNVKTILPVDHRNMVDATLTPTGQAMTYVQDGLLWKLELNEDFSAAGVPVQLTDSLTDNPSWSAGGGYLVYMAADRMMRFDVAQGVAEDITPELTWSRAQPVGRWTLRAGRLFDGLADEYRENVDVVIDGNRISSIGPMDASITPDIDASTRTVIPGLFEMHAHMGLNSESQGRVWLAYGVTTVRDPGSNPYLAKARQETWDSGRSIGPRTHVTGYLADGNRVYYSVAEGIATDAHLQRMLERAHKLELDFIKTYVRLPDAQQRRIVEFAHGIGIPVSSHEIYPAVAYGVDHVEHIGGTSRRGYQPKVSALGYTYGDVENLLAQTNMGMTATAVLPGFAEIAANDANFFATPQFLAFYGSGLQKQYQKMMRMFGSSATGVTDANGRLLRRLVQRDALLVTGTDAPFVPFGAGLHGELLLFERAGLRPVDVLKAATVKSAIAAGVRDDLGSLEPGMLADMVVVDGDPLARIEDADNVVMTIKNGRAYPLTQLIDPTR
ncbi:MAG: amidohydrolase family protein, partial [Proteobacteria bacterium]|nr:amidohydrolase family protein [Pseudomonadota bacterium]